jgi:Dimerisation domain
VSDLDAEKMFQMIRGYRVSQIVGALAELEIPDRLAHGPLSSDELAKEIGCDPEATHRLLRASASVDVVSAIPDGRFGLAPLGEKLRSNVPGSMRESAIALTKSGHWLPWGRLVESVRQGVRQTPATLGRELFEFYAENPEEGSAFTGAMSNLSKAVAEEVASGSIGGQDSRLPNRQGDGGDRISSGTVSRGDEGCCWSD